MKHSTTQQHTMSPDFDSFFVRASPTWWRAKRKRPRPRRSTRRPRDGTLRPPVRGAERGAAHGPIQSRLGYDGGAPACSARGTRPRTGWWDSEGTDSSSCCPTGTGGRCRIGCRPYTAGTGSAPTRSRKGHRYIRSRCNTCRCIPG